MNSRILRTAQICAFIALFCSATVAAAQSANQVDLTVQMTGPAGSTVQAGSTIEYKLTGTNKGPDTAFDVTTTFIIPNGLIFKSTQSDPACVPNGNQVHCHVFSLPLNAVKEYSVKFDVSTNTNLCNQPVTANASISTSSTETNPPDNQAGTLTHTIDCSALQADVRINKTGPATVQLGSTIVYQLTVINDGPGTASAVTVSDTLPTGLTFNQSQSSADCTLNGSTVHCGVNLSLSSGGSKPFTIALNVNDANSCGKNVSNTASVSTQTTDPNPANNQSTTVTTAVQCPVPTFTISKTDNRTTAAPDDMLNYVITIQNSSPTPANNITVVDQLPTSLLFLSASDNGQHNNSTVTWSNLNIPANGSKTLTLNAKVLPSTPNQTVITNTAAIAGGPNASDSTTVLVSQQPGCIDIVKETFDTNGLPLTPVAQFTFKLNTNVQATTNDSNGHAKFSNIPAGQHTVTEVLPTNWELLSVTPANGIITVQAGTTCSTVVFKNKQKISQQPTFSIVKTDGKTSASPGETLSYTITVTNTSAINANGIAVTDTLPSSVTFDSASDNGVLHGSTVTWAGLSIAAGQTKILTLNTTVNAGATNGTVLTNTSSVTGGPSATDTTTVTVGQTSFAMTKSDGKTSAAPGEILVYSIVVSNTSATDASNVQVVDTLPNGLQFISASNGGTSNGQTVTWNGLSLPAGQTTTLTLSAQVSASAANGTALTNTVQITGGPLAIDVTTVQSGTPMLTITKTDNKSTTKVGEILNYSIIITNSSSTAASNVTVEDLLPSQVSFVSATSGGSVNGQKVTWSNLSIGANAQLTLGVSAQVKTGTPDNTNLLNIAQILNGNSATDTTLVQGGTIDPNNITIDLTDLRDPVEPDETFCYNIRLTNLNAGTVSNLTVTQSLDSQTTFSSASNGGSRSGNSLRWSNVSIAGNGTINLSSCVRVDRNANDGDVLRSTAFVGNQSDEEQTDVGDGNGRGGDCRISSIEDTPDPVRAGETLTYNIRIRNERNRSERFNIRAYLDGNVSFLSASDGGDDITRREVEWDDFRISSNQTDTLRLTVRVLNEANNGETIRIRVDCDNDDDVESTRVEGGTTPPSGGSVSVSVDKQANRREAKPGDMVFYTVTVRNSTNRSAKDVSVQDRFTSGSISIEDASGGRVAGNGINWTIPTLSANDVQSYTYRIRVGSDMRHGQIIANTVRVSSADLDRDATDVEEVRVITDLPQTGLGGYFTSWKKSNEYLTASANAADEPSSGAATGLWATIISLGALAGGILGRKYFL